MQLIKEGAENLYFLYRKVRPSSRRCLQSSIESSSKHENSSFLFFFVPGSVSMGTKATLKKALYSVVRMRVEEILGLWVVKGPR
jgi:hypothetical protein